MSPTFKRQLSGREGVIGYERKNPQNIKHKEGCMKRGSNYLPEKVVSFTSFKYQYQIMLKNVPVLKYRILGGYTKT